MGFGETFCCLCIVASDGEVEEGSEVLMFLVGVSRWTCC